MPVSSSSQHRPPSCVTCSLLAPWSRALTRLLRVPLSIRAFRFRSLRKAAATMSPQRRRNRRRKFRSVRTVFWPLVPPSSFGPAAASAADQDDAARGSAAITTELLPAAQEVHAPVPSPETPAYVKVVARLRSGRSTASADEDEDDDDEERKKKEEACRSFESCLMEMLVEEGKARDLQDVEELLRCWERLKSPVFIDLVCRFYGELCNDMFPVTGDDDDDTAG
ncbi:hypothetical protein PR202_gb29721 [Eleusine coracana subsp. coracana]|uniref:OVATE domain-containing protein n=1 Tax=Eleusine coracana subsp. coracana TaxID=191504 RepID=A0AAV5G134_ELECO|nr:hypothetical protein QOZ80_5BG0424560 [Eleusine coracana subsp. coracana]GJN40500.1 hypothetical protein PR202_gb29721 [Eleusine coracana subsp. coracana]